MRLYVSVLLWVIGTGAIAQDVIISRENVKIPGKVKSTSGQLVRYVNSLTHRADSIATDAVREIVYKDSVRVLVVPIARRNQTEILTSVEFQEAVSNDNYSLLLHGKTSRYDLQFTVPTASRTVIALTPDTKIKLTPIIDLMKSRPDFSFEITVHSDTVGKAEVNQLLTNRQALALRNYLTSMGLLMNSISVSGRGESDLVNNQQLLGRRVDFRCTAIKGISILYAEKYSPSRRIEPASTGEPQATQNNTQVQSGVLKPEKIFSTLAYGEGVYTLQVLSGDWVDADKGLGILQGFGGGGLFTYYIKPRLGITAQLGYTFWAAKRRYIDANQMVAYTNDQKLERLSAHIGVRWYITPAIYLQPMAGGQQITLTNQNSVSNPLGVTKSVGSRVLPSVGGSAGYEINVKDLLLDLAVQYQLIFNNDYATITQPLHFAGLRLGVGYLKQKNKK